MLASLSIHKLYATLFLSQIIIFKPYSCILFLTYKFQGVSVGGHTVLFTGVRAWHTAGAHRAHVQDHDPGTRLQVTYLCKPLHPGTQLTDQVSHRESSFADVLNGAS